MVVSFLGEKQQIYTFDQTHKIPWFDDPVRQFKHRLILVFSLQSEGPEGKESPSHTGQPSDANSPNLTKQALRQAQLGRELQELNNALAKKQELASTMVQSEEKMEIMKIQYEVNSWVIIIFHFHWLRFASCFTKVHKRRFGGTMIMTHIWIPLSLITFKV